MIIAVDFDGTIVEHQYPKIGPNKTKAKNSDTGQSTSLWVSATSILVSIASLLVTIFK